MRIFILFLAFSLPFSLNAGGKHSKHKQEGTELIVQQIGDKDEEEHEVKNYGTVTIDVHDPVIKKATRFCCEAHPRKSFVAFVCCTLTTSCLVTSMACNAVLLSRYENWKDTSCVQLCQSAQDRGDPIGFIYAYGSVGNIFNAHEPKRVPLGCPQIRHHFNDSACYDSKFDFDNLPKGDLNGGVHFVCGRCLAELGIEVPDEMPELVDMSDEGDELE